MTKSTKRHLNPDTLLSTLGRDAEAFSGLVNIPVHRASTILYPDTAALKNSGSRDHREVVYGRYGTPTTFALQDTVAKIEGGYRSFVFGSGKAAILATLLAFLKSGDHLLIVDSAYGPSRELAKGLLAGLGITHTFYSPTIGSDISKLIRSNTRLIFTESPGSLTFEVQDLRAISEVGHSKGITVITDNTWASPLLCNPFSLGVDVSIQAATKYIVGHSDAMLGMVTTNKNSYNAIKSSFETLGSCAGPDDCYLALRGMRTLSVRLKKHEETALQLSKWLLDRSEVERVLYPALPEDPGYELWKRDFTGASGLFGIVLKPIPDKAVAALLDNLELFGLGYSWGGYESLAIPTYPHKHRETNSWDPNYPCIRFHAGLEDPVDLINDLKSGFDHLRKHR